MKHFVIRMFGESIKERMNELGMTKTALIKQAEISMDTLNRAISGRSVDDQCKCRQSLVSAMRCVSMITKVTTFGKPITTTLS